MARSKGGSDSVQIWLRFGLAWFTDGSDSGQIWSRLGTAWFIVQLRFRFGTGLARIGPHAFRFGSDLVEMGFRGGSVVVQV